MTATLGSFPVFRAFDAGGDPLVGGFLHSYAAGTLTPLATYVDQAGITTNTNPVELDSTGSANVWFGSSAYKLVLKTATGSSLWSVDNYQPDSGAILLRSDLASTASAALGDALVGFKQSDTSGVLTGAAARTVHKKLQESVSVLDFGADPTGVASSTNAFKSAIAASLNIYIPEGTYLIDHTGTSGNYLLYLGTQGGGGNPTSRNGMTIYGDGNKSIIKLGPGVGYDKLLFAGATGDVFANMTFRDFAIDLNGSNNLQSAYSDPTRYNSAFYFYCPCTNITFDNLYIHDGSGSQWIRCGNDSAGGYGANIKVLNCRFNNFGIGLTNNYSQDTSVCYLQADGILVDGCWFQNSDFTFDLTRGHTALELHGVNSTIVTNNRFTYTQQPILLVSSCLASQNIVVSENVISECNYLVSFDSSLYDQRRVTISGNIYTSTKSKSVIISIGASGEASKVRENILIDGNTITTWGNTNQGTHLLYLDSRYVRDICVQNNDIGGLNGYVFYLAGTVMNSGLLDLTVKNNRLDSLGPTTGTFPNAPAFIYAATSTGVTNTLSIVGNTLFNSSAKNYSTNGCFYISGDVNYSFVEGNDQSFNSLYPMVIDGITNPTLKSVQSSFFRPVDYRTGVVNIPASSSVNLYNFTGWGNSDSAMLEVRAWVGTGGTANNTVQFVNAGYLTSGGNVTTASNFGTYAGNISFNFSGTILRVTSTYASPLSMYLTVSGLATKPITWLV